MAEAFEINLPRLARDLEISYRQAHYLFYKGYIKSVKRGSGKAMATTYTELEILRVSVQFIKAGMELEPACKTARTMVLDHTKTVQLTPYVQIKLTEESNGEREEVLSEDTSGIEKGFMHNDLCG